MKWHFFLVTFLGFAALSAPVSASELKGADVVKALNGKAFDCSFNGGSLSWSFQKVSPTADKFPYTVKLKGRTIKAAYKLHKNGRMRQADTNQGRRVKKNKDGSLTISGNGIPTARCVYR